MVLLKEVKDTENGVIGVTEDGLEVRLKSPPTPKSVEDVSNEQPIPSIILFIDKAKAEENAFYFKTGIEIDIGYMKHLYLKYEKRDS